MGLEYEGISKVEKVGEGDCGWVGFGCWDWGISAEKVAGPEAGET